MRGSGSLSARDPVASSAFANLVATRRARERRPSTRPPERASAARTYRSSNSRRASASVARRLTVAVARVMWPGSACGPITPRCGPATMTDASTFCSSRTLPGQSYAPSTDIADGDSTARLPVRFESTDQTWRTSGGMSSSRSRSGGMADPQDVEPVAQIVAEPSGADLAAERPIGGRDDARIDLPRARFAEPTDLAFLQRAQQLGLDARAQLGDLIEKQGAALRLLEQSETFGDGAGEGAARVTEQLRLDELVGDRRAIERAEPPAATDARGVHRARHQLLSRSALPFNQHRERRGGGLHHGLPDGCQSRCSRRPGREPCAATVSGVRSRSRTSCTAGAAAVAARPRMLATSCGMSGMPIDQWHHNVPTTVGAVANGPRRLVGLPARGRRRRRHRYRARARRSRGAQAVGANAPACAMACGRWRSAITNATTRRAERVIQTHGDARQRRRRRRRSPGRCAGCRETIRPSPARSGARRLPV